jgi:hypothetical protein
MFLCLLMTICRTLPLIICSLFLLCINFRTAHFSSATGPVPVDDRTEHWPVKLALCEDLDKIKFVFEAGLLPVYIDDQFVQLINVQDMLKGALVEVYFELRHFGFAKKKEDSFNATVEQVLILQPGTVHPATAFNRKNVKDSPVHINPVLGPARSLLKNI